MAKYRANEKAGKTIMITLKTFGHYTNQTKTTIKPTLCYGVVLSGKGTKGSVKEYKVSDIHIYDRASKEIVVSAGCGYFCDSDDWSVPSVSLPISEITVKNEPVFNGEAFIIKVNKADNLCLPAVELYIPTEVLNIRYAGDIAAQDELAVYEVYLGTGYAFRSTSSFNRQITATRVEICLKKPLRTIPNDLGAIERRYKEAYRGIDFTELSLSSEEAFMSRIEELSDMAKRYHAEKKRILDCVREVNDKVL